MTQFVPPRRHFGCLLKRDLMQHEVDVTNIPVWKSGLYCVYEYRKFLKGANRNQVLTEGFKVWLVEMRMAAPEIMFGFGAVVFRFQKVSDAMVFRMRWM